MEGRKEGGEEWGKGGRKKGTKGGREEGRKEAKQKTKHLEKNLNTDVQESTIRISSSIQITVFSDIEALDFGSHHNILLRQMSAVQACD